MIVPTPIANSIAAVSIPIGTDHSAFVWRLCLVVDTFYVIPSDSEHISWEEKSERCSGYAHQAIWADSVALADGEWRAECLLLSLHVCMDMFFIM